MSRNPRLRRRDIGLLLGLALPGCAGPTGTAWAQQPNRRPPPRGNQDVVVYLPAMPCADRPGDLVGLVLEGSGAPAGTVVVFGQAFKAGDMPAGAGISARLAADGRELPAQFDVSRRHPDGSARFGLVSIAAPALPAGQRAGVVLSRRQGADPGAPLDFAAALDGRSLTVTLTPLSGGEPWRADLADLLRRGRSEPAWQAGPLARQARIALPAPLGAVRSLRCVADVAVRADGSLWVDLWLRNDVAMQPAGGDVAYALRLEIDGQPALSAEVPRHWQYGAWGRLVGAKRGGDKAPEPPRAIHDTRYLAAAGAVMPYDLSIGVGPTVFQGIARYRDRPDWDVPFNPRGLQTSMGAPGARPDLGQTTNWIAAWLMSGDARAAEFSIGQAEAAGGIPWHYWDPKGGADGDGGWLDVKRWPGFWSDPRGGRPPLTLLQRAAINTIWQRGGSHSHQPALSFVPYLLTGRRPFLDNLMAQGAWNVSGIWPAVRQWEGPVNDLLLVNRRQTRSASWTMRQVTEAAWIAADSDPTRAYIEDVARLNWAWLREQIPRWTEAQGDIHGYLEPLDFGYTPNLGPWQQDYFVSSAAMAAMRGQEDARAFLDWMRNYIVGRFFATQQGYTRNDAVAYRMSLVPEPLPEKPDPPRAPFRTWAEVVAANRERDLDNGTTWRHSNGEYPRLGMLSLALMAQVFDDARAKEAWQWLANSDALAARVKVFQMTPYHAVAPPGLVRVPEHAPRCTPSRR
ncbi:hypothetical protein DFH01_08185 [Falsiroseomonas bella]|uniref:Uncharacterized protein n=1 Tax=Falsiroseomonas bella TaxID=2184016 RepID=A0A317FJH5_9PROT|nr:hypothetical protein [Falsiroseomonas bella]PWS39201.1 hypothetical protein DFH01_08185 [Falsiroseomonas bella]